MFVKNLLKRGFSQQIEKHFFFETIENKITALNLNRPERKNAVSLQLIEGLIQEMPKQMFSDVIIIKSSTPGMFCSGADLKERAKMSEQEVKLYLHKMKHCFIMVDNLFCPTISVLDGPTLGGGLELALCTDFRIATKDAVIGLPETSLGIIPGAGGTQRLPRIIGMAKSKELIYTGRRINGVEAKELGLVNYVCDTLDEC